MLDPHGEYLTSAWRDHVYPLAKKMNMLLKKPTIQPRSRLAHEAAKWAGSQGRSASYTLALFRAFFQFGHDIGDKQVLTNLAADIGLDPAELGRSLDGGLFTGEVVRDEEEARRLGVRAVPSFVSNGRVLASGVQTAARLRELLIKGPGLSVF